MEALSFDQHEATRLQAKPKGGLRAIPFIIGNEIFEKVASNGLHANMIIYLTQAYYMSPATGAIVLLIWGALTNFTPLLGGFLSDSCFGRFRTIAYGSIVSLIGMVLLWLTAMLPGGHPPAHANGTTSPTSLQLTLLFLALAVMAIGSGGIRPCSLAFGADQLDDKDNPQNERVLQTFFNWYYASVGISIMIAVTVIVYIQDTKGWAVGFGVPVVLMVLSTSFFLLGSSIYIKVMANRSLLAGLAQVVVASFRNRHLTSPASTTSWWYHKKESKCLVPTDSLRFLNKACMIRDPEADVNPDGSASRPWKLCTVEQVEDLKSVLRVLPIWSSGFMVAVTATQSFPVLQASTMDRHLGRRFQIPAGSFNVFSFITLTLWVAVYDRLLVSRLAKLTGRPRGLSLKQRMGIGQVLSCVATAVAAVVEGARRRRAIEQGLDDSRGGGLVSMSAMWLAPQYCLNGLADALNFIGQIEFYYSEFPKSMSSVGVSVFSLGLGAGNLAGSVIILLVNRISGRNGSVSWLAKNLNKGHYDYYYWLLTLLGLLNVFYFLVCSWIYGEEGKSKLAEGEKKMEANKGVDDH